MTTPQEARDLCDFLRHVIDMTKAEHRFDAVRLNAEALLHRALLERQAQPAATITECEACFTPDVCQLRGTCDHYSAEQLRVAAPPAPQPLTDETLRMALHEIAEEWAGAECGEPVHAQEAYAIALAKRMYWIAAAALKGEAAASVEALRKDAERKDDALQQLRRWVNAYPLKVFPEPDFARAHELLTAGGMTLDAISASNMRHVITQVGKIIDAAMKP